MSINSLLETAKTALNVQKLALEVTGENIANVNTPGYSRQTAILETAITTIERGFPLGNGVKVAQVQRSYDDFLQKQTTAESSTYGEGKTVYSAMTRVEQLFNEFTTDGLGKSLQDFFKAWQDLTANPQGQPERQAVLSRAQQLVGDFHRINTYLNDVKKDMNASLSGITNDINDMLGQVANLNLHIKQIEVQSGNANELRDKRELLIRQLSQKVGITYTEQPDGMVDVNLTNGQPLVVGKDAATLSLQPNAVNPAFDDIMLTPPGGGPLINATPFIGGPGNSQGEVGGTLQVRDSLVDNYLSNLDELASMLANEVNGLHAAGFGLAGTTGNNFFNTPPAPIAGYSGSIGVVIADPGNIAAADTDPVANGTGNNIQARKIASVYDKVLATSGGNMTMEGFYNSIVGKVGVSVQNAERAESQSDGLVKQLGNLRESVSGVSLDEELANLIKYQKAFEGAAKVINVGTEMLDTVLTLVR